MAGPIRYAYLNEAPVVFDNDKAFEFFDGKWKPLNIGDAQPNARLLSKAAFGKYAGKDAVYPLPAF